MLSLIDALRKILAHGAEPRDCEYTYIDNGHVPVMAICGAPTFGPHAPDCPWVALPAILATLLAADEIMSANGPYEPVLATVEGHANCECVGPFYVFCHNPEATGHKPDCPWVRLLTTLNRDRSSRAQ